jgi:type I restriction enzyme, R subunit
MSNVGQRERATQNRVVDFFQQELNYSYLGDWQDREGNRNIEPQYLRAWLTSQGVDSVLIGAWISILKFISTYNKSNSHAYINLAC